MTTILCPLSGLPNVVLEKEIGCDWLIANYQQQLGIDVSRYFASLESIQIYKCLDTGYRFITRLMLMETAHFMRRCKSSIGIIWIGSGSIKLRVR